MTAWARDPLPSPTGIGHLSFPDVLASPRYGQRQESPGPLAAPMVVAAVQERAGEGVLEQ